jgi:hypothetical protein
VGKYFTNSPLPAIGVDIFSVRIIICLKIITAMGITIMITSPIANTAEIVDVNLRVGRINVTGVV